MKPHFSKGKPAPGARQWYEVRSQQKDAAEVLIYDEIGAGFFGGGVSAEQFVKDVGALGLGADDELTVRINSPGGDLFDGNTMYNWLRAQAFKVSVVIDGVAASAASIVAMAADTLSMPENSFLMIHNPWMFVAGDAATMRKAADDLDVMREGAVSAYASKTGGKLSRAAIKDMLDAETWLGASEAVEHGFADMVAEPVQAAALMRFDLQDYGMEHLPERLQAEQRKAVERKNELRAGLKSRAV